MNLVEEKITQATGLLEELELDLWLIFVRETALQSDPIMPLVVGLEVTWPSVFAFTRRGEAIALVGDLDEAEFRRSGCFSEVLTYTVGVKHDIKQLMHRLDPQNIGINYSTSDPSADGLTHGMYLMLTECLDGSPYDERLVSAAELCRLVRGRKTDGETNCLRQAAEMANDVWSEVSPEITPGMSEIAVAELIDAGIRKRAGEPSFATMVNAGDKTPAGHGHPTEAKLERGDLLHIDFGVRLDDYCSDIQRLLYMPRPKEKAPPAELLDAFTMVKEIITVTAEQCRPGRPGCEVDGLARQMLHDHGYPEYQHALGHQLGRAVHDGGAILGPCWERYGVTPTLPLEAGNAFTLELEIILPGIGCVGLEEDITVTPDGGRFLCPRQLDLIVCDSD